MSFVSRFRKPPDAVRPATEAVLVVHQHALSYRTSDWFGHADYHVRVFQPENARRPIIVIGDMDNHPVASITERAVEIPVIVANLLLGRPGVHPAGLDEHARWLTYFPADAVPQERFGELHGFRSVAPQYYRLRRDEAEGLVGGALGTWPRREYTAANLERRGARLIQVRPGDV